MRPTLATILEFERHGDKEHAELASRMRLYRASRATRYAARATVSQQKRRKLHRQTRPHGWKGGAR